MNVEALEDTAVKFNFGAVLCDEPFAGTPGVTVNLAITPVFPAVPAEPPPPPEAPSAPPVALSVPVAE